MPGLILWMTTGSAGCMPWNIQHWKSPAMEDRGQQITRLGLGHFEVSCSGKSMDEGRLRSLLVFALRKRGLQINAKALNKVRSNGAGYLTESELLQLSNYYSGRYWMRGRLECIRAEALLESRYHLDLQVRFLDLRTGKTIRSFLATASDIEGNLRPMLSEAVHAMDID